MISLIPLKIFSNLFSLAKVQRKINLSKFLELNDVNDMLKVIHKNREYTYSISLVHSLAYEL